MSAMKGEVTKCVQWRHSQATKSEGLGSLERSLAVLACFSRGVPVLSIADVAGKVGMSRSMAHRCMVRLVALGYLERDASRGYRLVIGVIDLEMLALPTVLHEYSHPCLEELCRSASYAVSLAVLEGSEIVYMDCVCCFRRDRDRLGLNVCIGSRQLAYATAMGKILMAYTPDAEQQQLVRELRLIRPRSPYRGKQVGVAE